MKIGSKYPKVGKFNVLYEHIESPADRPWLNALFSLMLGPPLFVEEHESGRGKTYIYASELFEPLTEGEEIPEYRIERAFNMAFAEADKEARRLNVGPFGFVAIRNHIIRVPPLQTVIRPATPGKTH